VWLAGVQDEAPALPSGSQQPFFGLALTGDIDFEALGNTPMSFPPNRRSEWPCHDFILSHAATSLLKIFIRRRQAKDPWLLDKSDYHVIMPLSIMTALGCPNTKDNTSFRNLI